MITQNVQFCRIFAARKRSVMAKTEYQEAAMNYAMDYLDRLLKMEGVVGSHVEKKIDRMMEQKFRKYLDDMKSEAEK